MGGTEEEGLLSNYVPQWWRYGAWLVY